MGVTAFRGFAGSLRGFCGCTGASCGFVGGSSDPGVLRRYPVDPQERCCGSPGGLGGFCGSTGGRGGPRSLRANGNTVGLCNSFCRQELVLRDVWECAARDKKLLLGVVLSCLKQYEKKKKKKPAGQTQGGFSTGICSRVRARQDLGFSTGMCSQRGAGVERRDGDATRIVPTQRVRREFLGIAPRREESRSPPPFLLFLVSPLP